MTKTDIFFTIDFNTQKLIHLFDSERSVLESINEIKFLISQLNEYQFLYFLNSIDVKLLEKNSFLELIILIEKGEPFYPEIFKGLSSFHSLKLKHKQTNLTDFLDKTNPIKSILQLIQFDYLAKKNNQILANQIVKKLCKITNEEKLLCSFGIDLSGTDENGYPSFLTDSFSIQNDRYTNKIDLLINELLILNIEYNWNTDRVVDKLITKASDAISKLYFNYNTKEVEYNVQLIYPLVFGFKKWKILIEQKIIESKKVSEFDSLKSFFMESLKQLKSLLRSNYIPLKYSQNKVSNCKESNSYVSIDKMIETIEKVEFQKKTNDNPLSSIDLSLIAKKFSCSDVNKIDFIFNKIKEKDFQSLLESKEKLISTKDGMKTSRILFELNNTYRLYSAEDLKALYSTGIVHLYHSDKPIDNNLFRKAKHRKIPLI